MKKKYEKPVFEKEKGLMIGVDIIKKFAEKNGYNSKVCMQCSGCHGCR